MRHHHAWFTTVACRSDTVTNISADNRTSLIVDPPNGTLPPVTAATQAGTVVARDVAATDPGSLPPGSDVSEQTATRPRGLRVV